MKTTLTLTKYFIKSISREAVMNLVMVLFPVILLLAAIYSSPEGTVPLVFDGKLLDPLPRALDVTIIIYSVTAVAFLASIMSFFISFELKKVMPRLRIMNYSSLEIGLALITLIALFNLNFTLIITALTLYWVKPISLIGYVISIYLTAVIFSLFGFIFSRLVDTKSLGILLLLTIVTMDTGFLENPVLSRRYNDAFMDFMPSHKGIESLFRSTFNTGKNWTVDLPFIFIYIITMLVIYLIILRLRR